MILVTRRQKVFLSDFRLIVKIFFFFFWGGGLKELDSGMEKKGFSFKPRFVMIVIELESYFSADTFYQFMPDHQNSSFTHESSSV